MQVARRSDMDMNGHINNVTYLAWALETVPADVYLNYSLQQARHPCCVTCTKAYVHHHKAAASICCVTTDEHAFACMCS